MPPKEKIIKTNDSSLFSESNEAEIILVSPRELIAHEKVSILRAIYVLLKMVLSGQFKVPLLIDSKTKTILDGHHRSYAAHRLGLKKIPCYCVNYLTDKSIRVQSRKPDILVDKERVIKMALSEKVFPRKTTRHEYKTPKFTSLKLKNLWK